jgi:putative addiction module component (TIGR02574 family)
MSNLTASILELSVPERLQLVQDLWDSLAEETKGHVAAADILEAERRLAEHEADPSSAIPWETVQHNLKINR